MGASWDSKAFVAYFTRVVVTARPRHRLRWVPQRPSLWVGPGVVTMTMVGAGVRYTCVRIGDNGRHASRARRRWLCEGSRGM